MIIDEKKLKRQEGQVQKWITEGKCSATLQAVTGFGKTYVAVLAIQRLHRKYPDVQVDVVVPKLDLHLDWINEKDGHIKKHQLKNVNVFVVNTYCKFGRRNIGLLIIDEIHNVASEEFYKTFQVAGCKKLSERTKEDPYILGLTATLERLDGKHKLLEEYAPIFDTVTMEEARREGYISNYKIYNLGLQLDEKDREEYNKWHNIFNNSFGKFNHNFPLAMACSKAKDVISQVTVPTVINGRSGFSVMNKTTKDWIYWWSQQQEWDGDKESFWSPSSIAKYAQQFMTSMRNRKSFIYRANIKVETTIAIVKKFPVKTMVFGEENSFADKIAELLGDVAKSYHTGVEGTTERVKIISKKGLISYKDKRVSKAEVLRRTIESFKSPNGIRVIVTTRKLNEGFDYEGVKLGIMASYNSSKKDDTQRSGRTSRKDYADLSKTAIIINLYIKDSQEEKWLKDKQRGKSGIQWINSIEEINMESTLLLK